MKSSQLILAFDFGTSGVKTALVTHEGRIVASATSNYPLHTPQINYAQQDPEDYWRGVCKCTKAMLEGENAPCGEKITAISMCTQGMGIIPVDYKQNVLCECITWLDNRAGAQAKQINARMGKKCTTAASVVAKLLWIKQNEPQIYENAAFFLDVTGYINMRLTGNIFMELTNSSPYSLNTDQLTYKRRLYEAAQIDLEKMPPLKICSEFVGQVTLQAAAELGITTKVKVYMGSGDVPAAAAGAGCCRPSDAHVCLASSGWLSVITDTRCFAELSPGIYQIYSVNKNALLYGGGIQQVGFLLDWAIEQFYHAEKMTMGEAIYDFVSAEVSQIAAGSEGLVATPWLCGESCPVSDENAKAVFLNITNKHDRRHFIKSLMESVCYSLRWMLEYYKNDSGMDIERIGAVGGCAANRHWLQMVSDVLQLPVYVPENVKYAGALGSAVIAGVGMGWYTFENSASFIPIQAELQPNPDNAEVYDRMFNAFQQLYPALQPIYQYLNVE